MTARVCLIIAVSICCQSGCEKPKPAAQTTTTVRQHSAIDVGPATRPATRPTISQILIDGREVSFPPARMVLQQAQPTVDLLLFSDDPPNALSATYTGNRYYFDLKLEIDDLEKLAASDMHWKAASIERADAPDGIFLDGDKKSLQPYDLQVVFNQQAGKWYSIDLAGEFLLFGEKDDAAPPKRVLVRGTLLAELEM